MIKSLKQYLSLRGLLDKKPKEKTLSEKAADFARLKHANQKRKYTSEPYFNHCEEVANILQALSSDGSECKGNEELIAAAYLHDTLEDTDTTYEELVENFGSIVAKFVLEVTDVSKPSDGNREARKKLDRLHIAKSSRGGMNIKLADLISNSRSIVQHDKNFAKVYLEEKKELLDVLIHGDLSLFHNAVITWSDAMTNLENNSNN